MGDICRVLHTDLEVERFVDGVLNICDINEKREAINAIAAAERNIVSYPQYPTWLHRDNRDFEWREDKKRKKLRTQIVEELYTQQRLDNDDIIELGQGGAAPQTMPKKERKAIYLIGPPASGKSTIASIVADVYGAYIIDSDYAKRKLPEYKNQIGGASLVHEESSHLVFDTNSDSLIFRCLEQGNNIVVPKIGDNLESIIKFADDFKSIGYSVYLISIDLDRQKATQRAYYRYKDTSRYVPLSLIFDKFSNQPTLNYFKVKQRYKSLFAGFAQISTDVPKDDPAKPIEIENMDEISTIEWRRSYAKV